MAGLAVLVGRGVGAPQTGSAAPTTSEPVGPIILSGVEGRTSDPFFLEGGTYKSLWSAWGQRPDDPPCTHSVTLLAVEPDETSGGRFELARRVQVPATGTSAELFVLNLSPGDYYFQISSACAWQVELHRNQ